MHPLERAIAGYLERGEEPPLSALGDTRALVEMAADLGRSPLMPELLKPVLSTLPNTVEEEREILMEFVCRCVEAATDDLVLRETVDLLDGFRPLSDKGEERLFARFMVLASDRAALPMSRAAALDGAFRWSFSNRRRQLRLLDLLLGIEFSDNLIFLARAAKIIGVAYSHWREAQLVEHLRGLSEIEGVASEAAFELGMSQLADAFEVDERQKAAQIFGNARHWFVRSSEEREQRPDAAAFIGCLDVITAFSRGEGSSRLGELASSLLVDAFQMNAWHSERGEPPWLGARHAESACWNTLAVKLGGLAAHLEEASWWEPAVVIEQYLLACYVASRSVLRKSRHGGIEALIRPTIEGALAKREGQAYHLKEWLRINAGIEEEEAASGLARRIDELVSQGTRGRPSEATTGWPPVVALLDEASISPRSRAAAKEAIRNALAVHLGNLSDTEIAIIDDCLQVVSESSDYTENPNGRQLFDAVLVFTVRFLNNRLEMTNRDDPGVSYLFERDDGSLSHENELQADYSRFMFSVLAGTEIEISNIGGGRADVRFSYRGERLVTEVKREDRDSSFENLAKLYGAQATDYQNVSIRLGVLLVLDLVEKRRGGTPHISSLVKPSRVMRKDESDARWIVMVKVPGRRLRPSDLTKESRKS